MSDAFVAREKEATSRNEVEAIEPLIQTKKRRDTCGKQQDGPEQKKEVMVNVCVDMSESFSSPNGSFYVGTTEAEIANAVKLATASHLFIYSCDVHCAGTLEFETNGGSFPPHNIIFSDPSALKTAGVAEGKSASPKPVSALCTALAGRPCGIIAPRHVFFQSGKEDGRPDFGISDLEAAFGTKWIYDSTEISSGHCTYVISGVTLLNGATLHMLRSQASTHYDGVPDSDCNVFALLREKYGHGTGLHFVVTGAILSISVYQTASNIKQMLPKARVTIAWDACTPLPRKEDDEKDWVDIVDKMSKQIGITVTSTEKILSTLN